MGDSWKLRDGFTIEFFQISYFLLGESLARCKFFSEMKLQFINIIEDMFTKLADFSYLLEVPKKSIDQSQTF